MIVGELLVAMRNPELVQPPHESAGTVEQIELILLAAVDVERLQPAEIVRPGFDRNDRVLPQPIRPAFLDNLAGVERDGQPHPEELRGIGIVAGRHRQRVDHFAGTLRMLSGCFELMPPALDGVFAAGQMSEWRSACVSAPYPPELLPNTPRRPAPPHPKRSSIAGNISCSR